MDTFLIGVAAGAMLLLLLLHLADVRLTRYGVGEHCGECAKCIGHEPGCSHG